MNDDISPRPVESDAIPHEVMDLVRFMCVTWSKIDAWAYKHCDGDALMHYPVVQGTSNQIRLQRIGEQPHDAANIRKAVEWMQRYNIGLLNRKEKQLDKDEHEATVRRLVKLGDTLTHTRCMGCVEEHIYTGDDGRWLCGKPTRDTVRLGGSKHEINDISPCNVTHINRVPVEAVEFLAQPKSPSCFKLQQS